MKSKLGKSLFLLILPFFAFTVTEWVAQKIDDNVTISFPAKPENLAAGSITTWKYTSDSALIFAFGTSNLELGVEFTKEDFEKPGGLKSFSDGIVKRLKGSKVISSKRSTLAGYPVYEVLLEVGEGINAKKMYTQTVFVGTKTYALYYYELTKPQPKGRQQFFASFKVDKK